MILEERFPEAVFFPELPDEISEKAKKFIRKETNRVLRKKGEKQIYEAPEMDSYEALSTQKHITNMSKDVISATFHFHYRK